MTHYVLTASINEYDQYGDYYCNSWDHPPSIGEILNSEFPSDTPTEKQAQQLIETGGASDQPYCGQWSTYELIKKG